MKAFRIMIQLYGIHFLTFVCTTAALISFASCQTLVKDKEEIKKITNDIIDDEMGENVLSPRKPPYKTLILDDAHSSNTSETCTICHSEKPKIKIRKR